MISRAVDLHWQNVIDMLWEHGFSRLGVLLSENECKDLRNLYSEPERFRSRIDMLRYRFGTGEYQYFCYALPETVSRLRNELYASLAPVANSWVAALGVSATFPEGLAAFLEQCRAHGQGRPTPLLLRYRDGDFNCLHQDVSGELIFPFQAIVALSSPIADYSGGELLLAEQKPRAQSRGHAIRLTQGEGIVISTRFRPVKSSRGFYRAVLRHGVSTVTSGERFTLGVIFHDSK